MNKRRARSVLFGSFGGALFIVTILVFTSFDHLWAWHLRIKLPGFWRLYDINETMKKVSLKIMRSKVPEYDFRFIFRLPDSSTIVCWDIHIEDGRLVPANHYLRDAEIRFEKGKIKVGNVFDWDWQFTRGSEEEQNWRN